MRFRIIGLFWMPSLIDLNYNQLCEKSGSLLMKLISSENRMPVALAFLPEGCHVLKKKAA
jgi:hypothetical protein